jgi:amino acid adenylation domain-containing protein/non-ribosomal peptide synthase protein (TIGR01720 family)
MSERSGLEIAIIGMAGRFPKAANLEQFWQNLRTGVEGITFFTDEELSAAGIPPALVAHPNYVKAAAIIDGIELFDANFFGIAAREAEILDPQHKLLLECAWEALEKAGYVGTRRPVGVFAGSAQNSYVFNNLIANPEILVSQGRMAISLANEKDFLASRLSYKLGLEGPSVSVQTACSTSLTAVHLACQSLLSGDCELALAGGVSIQPPQHPGYLYQPDSTSSPDGRCRTFDAAARGTMSGQGFGMVVLRLLEDALAAGDHIHAVIKGSAANNDGSLRVGFTAPSRDGQARVIAAAQMRAEVEADSISYVEAHGTATPLGDPIEVAALTKAFRETTDRRGFCALGSVKTGIGHLDAAAGIASLIKATLALEHQEIPPNLHFETPNPEIDFESSPFYVVTRLTPWAVNGHPRRAGVSSFGLGGTNVHVVLEEAPPPPPPGPSRAGQILILSARSAESLERATDNAASWLEGHPEAHLPDVAHTLQVGRVPFPHRRALVVADRSGAGALRARDPRRVWSAEVEPGERQVAFLLPGVGDHYPGMAQGLYRTERVFREELDRCAELLRPHLGLDLREALLAGAEEDRGEKLDLKALLGRGAQAPKPGLLHETRIAQPAVMAVSWALAQLWISWGVRPQALLGYSLGEYTAACLAGVMPLDDGLSLVARRAQLIDGLPPGAMLAVPLSEAALLPRLAPGLSLAAENGPGVSVVAGPVEAVDAFERQLGGEGISCRRLPTTHAFHSTMMEPVRDELARLLSTLRLAPPRIPYLSNVTGTWITAGQATDPLYWAGHLCRPVRFGRAVETLWGQPHRVLLEVGPGQGLSTLALQHSAHRGGAAFASLRHAQDPQPDDLFLLGTLARLWLTGVAIDWEGFSAGEARRRVPLPTYPFERRRYWIDPPELHDAPAAHRQAASTTDEERSSEAVPAAALLARHERPRLLNPYVAPVTSEQQRLAALWQELLGIAPVGLYDNFFELGGHSLLGTQLLARMRAELGVEVPLSALFESPTVADLARALGEPASGVARPPLRTRPPGLSELPLSFTQQRLWFLDQLEPDNPFYNLLTTFQLTGPFSPDVARAAFREIIRRHESLRTAFPAVGAAPSQVIAPQLDLDMPLEDLSALPEPIRHRHALRRGREEGRRIFDLSHGPLLRIRFLRLEDQEHVLLLTMHHIISDGWSIQVLLGELVTLYAAFSSGRPSPLPELPVQYGDYALWQRQWLEGGALDEQLAWWREHLAGAPPALEMPTDRPYPAAQTYDGGTRTLNLPPGPGAALSRLALAAGASPFMALIAVFNLLLHRISGQDDIVVGTPIANRTLRETETMIGMFVNTLALRTDLSGAPSFRELLARTRRTTLGAYDHQDMPFDRLVEELQPERGLSRPPIFQVFFQLLNQPVPVAAPGSFTAELFEAEAGLVLFDLILSFRGSGDARTGTLKYNTGLFDASTIDRMIGHFLNLLAGAVADPERPVAELPLLSAAERHEILVEWNDTARPTADALPVHRLFERQAERTPDAAAVSGADGALTYSELDRAANRLARLLRRRGAGPGTRVGLCAERSLDLVTGVLGVLKAGAAYVPLDPGYPQERLAWMLQDSGAAMLLTQERLVARLPETAAPILRLDADRALLERESPSSPSGGGEPEDLAYVIYTSGSTGRPKGVMVPHRGLSNYLDFALETYAAPGAAGSLLHTSISFDLSVTSLFVPLLSGQRLVLVPEAEEGSEALAAALPGHADLAFVKLTPSHARMLGHQLLPGSLAGRSRSLVVGGEALLAEDLTAWREGAPQTMIYNEYGPTEAVVGCSLYAVPAGQVERGALPIGRPIPGARIYLLDRLEAVPLGSAGELCVGGPGLARGYLGRPDLTAERFTPDPSGDGCRLYRTGDLARWSRRGELEYLGRIDQQVKIRGFRIEPGEIEAALLEHGGVREAAVVARKEGDVQQLVAFYVPRTEPGVGAAELQQFLAGRLPAHMVPSVFTTLAALPLTPNGKVDVRALVERPSQEDRYRAPRTPVEELLAQIWSELLRVERVGIDDNFFSLGGDSILSLQAASRASRAGYKVTSRQLFKHQTIAELATVAVPKEPAATAAAATAQKPTGSVPLTPIQRWFFDARPLDPHHFNHTVLLTPREPVSPAVVERALAALLDHHDALRLRFAEENGVWRARNEPAGGAPPWSRLDLSGLPLEQGWAAWAGAAAQVQASLDLSAGPLLRGVWLDLAEQQTRLLFVIHHLAIDGVSWRILLEDLETACRQLGRGETVTLPPQTTSFQEWAQRLEKHALDRALESELPWWRHEAEAPASDLPFDHPNGENTERSVRRVSVSLDADETRALLQEVPAVYRTQINDVLLTALARALAGPGRALLVQLEGHGREEIFDGVDLSRTVGWFTSLFPVHLEAGPAADPGAALRNVKEHLRAVPRRGLGYGLLRWLRGGDAATRELARPQPAVTFNYLGQFDGTASEASLFAVAGETTGPTRSARGHRLSQITVDSMVSGGRLRINWIFSENLHEQATVEVWAEEFLARLRELIVGCREAAARRTAGYTPSDFPLAGVGRRELDRLLGTEWGIEDVYPLSPVQEGILFHSLFEASSGTYVGQLICSLEGSHDARLLEAACQLVADHRPLLRTSLHWQGLERPLQVVHGEAAVTLESEDWRGLAPGEMQRRLEELMQSDRARGLDLSRAPVMRWRLLRTAEQEYRLLWSHHHVLLDGWSFSILARELLACYEALRTGTEPALPRRRPYRDYIAWLLDQNLAAAEEYWRQTLAGWTEPTPLTVDRRNVDGARGTDRREVWLSAEATAALEARARGWQVTLNTLVQAAWALLLARYSGRPEVVFGATVSGRPAELPEAESMVGLFINTLPVRVAVEAGTELASWVRGLQLQQADLRQHEHSPLVKIQEWSGVPRGIPLFESILVFENYPRDRSMGDRGSSLGVAGVRAVEQTNYPLTLVTGPGERLLLHIASDRSRFDAATVERMLGHLGMLIEGISAAPEIRPAELPLLTAAERQQALADWNDTGTGEAEGETGGGRLHQLFEAWAERTPSAIAILFEGAAISYGELEGMGNRLARRLQALGVGPESRVGLCFQRSPAALAAMLGVLKAGGSYVPLDPESPRERLAGIAADAGISLLLTQELLAPSLSGLADRLIAIDDPAERLADESPKRPACQALPDNAAYVIYTSGSTGTAKGVVGTHRSVVNFTRAFARTTELGPDDRLLLFAPLSFDASVLQIFPPLASGAAVVVHPDPRELASHEILALCKQSGMTVLDLPAALWRQWVEDVAAQGLPLPASLRCFLTGGESVSVARLRAWAGLAERPLSFLSSYGPTEATVTSTVFTTWNHQVPSLTGDKIPIGRPLPGTRAHVLDRALQPAPCGVPGELFLGGAGLTRGYLKRPELTADAVRPDPFAGEPGGRLYRTGDLAVRLEDGSLEFLGRADHQVKLRGFRVELGEIEAALLRHPAVLEAVAVVREDRPGDQRLAAYAVPREGHAAPSAAELRASLLERLPAYMVPAVVTVLPEMPVLPSGKLDRAALPAPASIEVSEHIAPRSPVEQVLAGIWAEVLGAERVGAFDNFFELGGHSLSATRVVSRIREELQVDLELRRLFESPTLSGLAESLLADPEQREWIEKTAELTVQLAGLSEEQVEAMLAAGQEGDAT